MKKICLVLALMIVLTMILAGCEGSNSLPYVGPVDGSSGSDDGGVTPTPPDDGGTTPPPPPPGGDTGGVQPPSPPVF